MSICISLDIETTGWVPGKFTRFTAIKHKDHQVIDIFDQMVNPQMQVRPDLLEKTGLNQKILDQCPTIEQLKPTILRFLKDHPIYSWGNFENKWLPPFGLARVCFDSIPRFKAATGSSLTLENYKLNTVCEALNIPLRHHDSLSDALAVYHILNLTGLHHA